MAPQGRPRKSSAWWLEFCNDADDVHEAAGLRDDGHYATIIDPSEGRGDDHGHMAGAKQEKRRGIFVEACSYVSAAAILASLGAIAFAVITWRRNQLSSRKSGPSIEQLEAEDAPEQQPAASTLQTDAASDGRASADGSEEASSSSPAHTLMHQNAVYPFSIGKKVLAYIENCLQREHEQAWKQIYTNKTNTLSYTLKKREVDQEPTEYLSTTIYKDFPDINKLKAFMMDNEYKMKNDSKFKHAVKLDADPASGTMVWHIAREYPYLGRRDYVTASKSWEQEDEGKRQFFCVTKACKHPITMSIDPKTLAHDYFSGWRISKANNSMDCEVKLFHKEDLKSTAAKMVKNMFISSVWAYVLETEKLLRNY